MCHSVWREMPRRFFHNESTDGWSIIMRLADSLQNLRKMSLKVPLFYVAHVDPISPGSLSRLLQLIQKAPGLDTLYLDFVTYEYTRDSPSYEPNDISELLEGITLPRLRNLRLNTCQFNQGTVIDLLTRHSRELRSLHLENAEIVFNSEHVGSWKEVMHRIAPKMSLVHVHLIQLEDMEILKIVPDIRDTHDPHNEVRANQRYERVQAYTDAIARFLLHRGQIDYPKYGMLHVSSTGHSSKTEEDYEIDRWLEDVCA